MSFPRVLKAMNVFARVRLHIEIFAELSEYFAELWLSREILAEFTNIAIH